MGAPEVLVTVDLAMAAFFRATLTDVLGTVVLVLSSAELTIRDDHCCDGGLDVDVDVDVVWALTAPDPTLTTPVQTTPATSRALAIPLGAVGNIRFRRIGTRFAKSSARPGLPRSAVGTAGRMPEPSKGWH